MALSGGGCSGGCSGKTDYPEWASEELKKKTEEHPCYTADGHKNARMHIPVAPKCNIQCNYCNRLYDCVNESRPGVTSGILTPEGAAKKYSMVKEKIDNLKVVGIAGPGDALANFEETKKSIELIKEQDPDVIICLSTNGLMLPDYAEEIVALGISHVTVTLNSIDPKIGAKIYEFVNYKGEILKGEKAAKVLQDNQLKGIEYLAKNGVLCKINIVLVKGVNEHHIPEVVKKARELGAFMTNIMPLIPASGTVFENLPLTSKKELNELRNKCSITMKQMYHCQQCRADAIGQLTQDRSLEFRDMGEKPFVEKEKRDVLIAVASKSGKLIDQHFGQADKFHIYKLSNNEIKFVEERNIEKYCTGVESCDDKDSKMDKVLKTLGDCKVVLSVRIGYGPKQMLRSKNIQTYELYDTIEDGINTAFQKING
ncbi:nitrogenase cofactor biosynthesis protein NifB [uncultured Ilyobacter sp.]|uniref:nitrogenase cofactor biosynthesis protein NifB n=1 Tax=uncultured Ilyobacter sp. TaxID=544433 RepID=UPI0029F56CDE|nr:nitrogenase cofactor biosynthesis protein NifB [uncultured Ilyobacter sp.]